MKSKYQISTVILVLLVVIFISISLFDFTPQVLKVWNLKQKLTTKQMNFQQLKEELDSKQRILKTKLDNHLSGQRLLEAIPYQMKTNQFLYQIKELLAENKLTLNKYLPEEKLREDNYTKLPIFLEITGNYSGINSFFKELEDMNRLVTIEKVKLFQTEDKLKINLMLAIYSLAKEEDKNE